MTYSGVAHIASLGGVGGPKAIAYDNITRRSYNIVYTSMTPSKSQGLTDYTFSLDFGGFWKISTSILSF